MGVVEIRNLFLDKALVILKIKYNILKSLNQEKGIPLGNLTSQLFANIFLNELDNFVKHKLKKKYYIRYMDDFLFFSSSKKELWKNLEEARGVLKKLNLELHPKKTKILSIQRGIVFVGYNIFSDHILLKKDSVKRIMKKLGKGEDYWENTKKASFKSYAKISNYFKLNNKLFNERY